MFARSILYFALPVILAFAGAAGAYDPPNSPSPDAAPQRPWNHPSANEPKPRPQNEGPGATSMNRGPWANDLMVRRSLDGVRYGAESVLVPAGGVPSAIRTRSGRILLAFQWFPQDEANRAYWDKVAVIASDDSGATWGAPMPIAIRNLPSGFQRPFDPTLVELPDGGIRIVFSSGPRRMGMPDGEIAAHMAISSDGVNYVYETGPILLSGTKYPVIDPAILRFNGVWHYTAPHSEPGSPHEKPAYHAVSKDGVNFRSLPRIAAQGENWTGNLIRWGKGMRFYGGGRNGIWWSYSENGDDWTKPLHLRIQGGDPTIVETGGGAYLLIYVAPSKEATSRRNPTAPAGPGPGGRAIP